MYLESQRISFFYISHLHFLNSSHSRHCFPLGHVVFSSRCTLLVKLAAVGIGTERGGTVYLSPRPPLISSLYSQLWGTLASRFRSGTSDGSIFLLTPALWFGWLVGALRGCTALLCSLSPGHCHSSGVLRIPLTQTMGISFVSAISSPLSCKGIETKSFLPETMKGGSSLRECNW